jgi:hypothetical protein
MILLFSALLSIFEHSWPSFLLNKLCDDIKKFDMLKFDQPYHDIKSLTSRGVRPEQ